MLSRRAFLITSSTAISTSSIIGCTPGMLLRFAFRPIVGEVGKVLGQAIAGNLAYDIVRPIFQALGLDDKLIPHLMAKLKKLPTGTPVWARAQPNTITYQFFNETGHEVVGCVRFTTSDSNGRIINTCSPERIDLPIGSHPIAQYSVAPFGPADDPSPTIFSISADFDADDGSFIRVVPIGPKIQNVALIG